MRSMAQQCMAAHALPTEALHAAPGALLRSALLHTARLHSCFISLLHLQGHRCRQLAAGLPKEAFLQCFAGHPCIAVPSHPH